jgi:hypothetical protein
MLWAFRGEQAQVAIRQNDKRVLFGTINPRTGTGGLRRPRQRQETFKPSWGTAATWYPDARFAGADGSSSALKANNWPPIDVTLLWAKQCPELNSRTTPGRSQRLIAANRQFRTIDDEVPMRTVAQD